jgi:uncharacterized RDD family membrane protein YckC
MERRYCAGLLDFVVVACFTTAVILALDSLLGGLWPKQNNDDYIAALIGLSLFATTFGLGPYFGISEAVWGASLGKKVCGLQVVQWNGDRLRPGRAALRTSFLIAFILAMDILVAAIVAVSEQVGMNLFPLAVFAVVAAARRKNGSAAWLNQLDLVTLTRVVEVKRVIEEKDLRAVGLVVPRSERPVVQMNITVGPYYVLEELVREENYDLLLGYDDRLQRMIWIQRQALRTNPPHRLRCELARKGRLRWLGGRLEKGVRWDAYEAPSGKPLAAFLQGPQPWISVRHWLGELAEELSAAQNDGNPAIDYKLDRVWITDWNQAILLDFPAPGADVRNFTGGDELDTTRDLVKLLLFRDIVGEETAKPVKICTQCGREHAEYRRLCIMCGSLLPASASPRVVTSSFDDAEPPSSARTGAASAKVLLLQVAVAALEGRRLTPTDLTQVFLKQLPLRAQKFLNDIERIHNFDAFLAELNPSLQKKLAVVSRVISRDKRLALQSLCSLPFLLPLLSINRSTESRLSWSLLLCSLFIILGSTHFRHARLAGGWWLLFFPSSVFLNSWLDRTKTPLWGYEGPLMASIGVQIVQMDGTPASWKRLVKRSLITWSPVLILSLIWGVLVIGFPNRPPIPWLIGRSLMACLAVIFLVGVVWSLATPDRTPADRFTGTLLVPK